MNSENKGKAFFDYANEKRYEQIKSEVEIELQLVELAVLKDDFAKEDIRKKILDNNSLANIEKQVNDLHVIVMSDKQTKPKPEKAKKLTQKEKIAQILAKRALDASTKNN
ncbi:hypothetical protein ACFOG5_09760 [Pedobacter fastidiosus]|uniref:Uncharacterized protein n=1 Tax=Pedobacter fastidiosus TaxID=2765361 RepID=A0ABR7KXX7_9SPHI|nr:hypothetical protein [Pedobacter fastidiosus]MBC6112983.1 hypothetical protein [Pedobacter fastidiosus]